MKLHKYYNKALNYDDVFFVPKYSDVITRKDVDISADLDGTKIPVPVIAANMETVINGKMCMALNNAGALGALHRFQTIEEACEEFGEILAQRVLKNQTSAKLHILVSIGVNRDSHERAQALYEWGARNFVIDIAHGHSKQMREMIEWFKTNFNDIYLMAGNVATQEATEDLIKWGADGVKVGIGPGSVCLTKNVTGVTVPGFSSVLECSKAARAAEQSRGKKINLIADGGLKEIGDICKAIGAGADFIMSGRFFAACDEAPQGGLYRGSASSGVQEKYRTDKDNMPTPEGTDEMLEGTGPVANVVEHIAGGLRSAYSYCGARNMKEFHERCEFGVRYNKT